MLKLWLIERVDTGEALSQFQRGDDQLTFGGRAIVYWTERRFAKRAWIDYCKQMGWIKKGITLAGGEKQYARTDRFEDCPEVQFRQVTLHKDDAVVLFSRDELEAMTYDPAERGELA